MSVQPEVSDRLVALDARVWAQLMRALRALDPEPGALADALRHPTGELASGPARRGLCDALAASDAVLAALRDDDGLPAALHVAIAMQGAGDGDRSEDEGAEVAPGEPDRAADRERALRRSLDEERRRREGAEARAATAEARARSAEEERDALEVRVTELDARLVDAHEATERSVARTERRSASRIGALEDDLAEERSAHAVSRRELERARGELVDLRAELDVLRSRDAPVSAAPAGASGDGEQGRPLVLPSSLDATTTEAARWLAARASLLIVDGYNVTLQLRPGQPLDEQRRWLVERLRPLVVRGGPAPVVVFDGDGANGRLRDTGGVEVRFTASGIIADDEIVFSVAATDEPVLVVTDDAELRDRVRAEGGNVIGVVHLSGIVDA